MLRGSSLISITFEDVLKGDAFSSLSGELSQFECQLVPIWSWSSHFSAYSQKPNLKSEMTDPGPFPEVEIKKIKHIKLYFFTTTTALIIFAST